MGGCIASTIAGYGSTPMPDESSHTTDQAWFLNSAKALRHELQIRGGHIVRRLNSFQKSGNPLFGQQERLLMLNRRLCSIITEEMEAARAGR